MTGDAASIPRQAGMVNQAAGSKARAPQATMPPAAAHTLHSTITLGGKAIKAAPARTRKTPSYP